MTDNVIERFKNASREASRKSEFFAMHQRTLGNYSWMSQNEDKLKDLFPETWTHRANINGLQLMFKAKLYGIDYRTQEQLSEVLVFLTNCKLVQVDGDLIRRNPNRVFKPN